MAKVQDEKRWAILPPAGPEAEEPSGEGWTGTYALGSLVGPVIPRTESRIPDFTEDLKRKAARGRSRAERATHETDARTTHRSAAEPADRMSSPAHHGGPPEAEPSPRSGTNQRSADAQHWTERAAPEPSDSSVPTWTPPPPGMDSEFSDMSESGYRSRVTLTPVDTIPAPTWIDEDPGDV